MEFDSLSKAIIGAALRVHSCLGSGLFEEIYKVALRYELQKANIQVLSEVGLPFVRNNL